MAKLSDAIRRVKNTTCSAVVVAAGASRRMGEDKLKMQLGGQSVLARTLLALNGCDCIREIVVVTRADKLEEVARLCQEHGVSKAGKIVVGGESRTESALAGLTEIDRQARYVLIHDGARPLVTPEVVEAALHGAALYKCASAAIPVTDTIKMVENGVVSATLPREKLYAMQTPQAFVAELVKTALSKAVQEGKTYTDDCAAVEALGVPVHLTEGSPENIKITRPTDVTAAEAILRRREAEA